jgi:ketosteroid isomerase-like protein
MIATANIDQGPTAIAKRSQYSPSERPAQSPFARDKRALAICPGACDTSQIMTENDLVLAANLEFYRAFGTSDYAAMNALWARDVPVVCVHPGWPPLAGREAVMRSWRNILTNPDPTRVACHDDQAFLYDDFAVVVCEEELSAGHLVASNMFVKQGGQWRMVHHQASPIVGRPQDVRRQRRRNERR